MDQVQRSQGDKEMWMQLTQIKFGSNLEQMHKQLKQEHCSGKVCSDGGGGGEGGGKGDGPTVGSTRAPRKPKK